MARLSTGLKLAAIAMLPLLAFARAPAAAPEVSIACENLTPTATIGGKVISIPIRYCGQLVRDKKGNQDIIFRQLMMSSGHPYPIWPSPSLVGFAQKMQSDYAAQISGDTSGQLSDCAQRVKTLTAKEGINCARLALAAGDAEVASGFIASIASKAPPSAYAVDYAAAVVLTPPGNGDWDWIQRRWLVLGLLSAAGKAGNKDAQAVMEMDGIEP